jgi:DNA-binding response OmpR family regulator
MQSTLFSAQNTRDRQRLIAYLEERDMKVRALTIPSDGLDLSEENSKTDFFILHIRGFSDSCTELLKTIRSSNGAPVMVIDEGADEIDKILAIEMGATDYVQANVHDRVILARIHAMLRREKLNDQLDHSSKSDNSEQSTIESQGNCLEFAGWQLNIRTRMLTSPTQLQVKLTNSEFTLLMAFIERRNRVLSRDLLLQACYEDPSSVFDRNIDYLVLQLRKKLEADPKKPTIIKTEHGAGYLFSPKVSRPKSVV